MPVGPLTSVFLFGFPLPDGADLVVDPVQLHGVSHPDSPESALDRPLAGV